ncbi:MAG: hypothetical protein JRF33_06085 [Deltaproteobacteria bacterium]|nr:hypothetical protein [Deltaproteobacteria bacterium]
MRTRISACPGNLFSLGRGGKATCLFIVAVVFAPGCAGFNGEIRPLRVSAGYLRNVSAENPIQTAPITVFFEKPEVQDKDEEQDFTPIAETFALSLRQWLSLYLCDSREVLGRCIDRPAEGAYRMTTKVVVDNYRSSHGGLKMAMMGGLLLPPLLGLAWSVPICLGTCDVTMELTLFSPGGKALWEKNLTIGNGLSSCSDGDPFLYFKLREQLEVVVGGLSQTAARFEETAAREREAQAKKIALVPAPSETFLMVVFAIEDRGAQLEANVKEQLSEYLASTIAASGRYKVIPRAQLKERLGQQKTESYKACYDQKCQIEMGKELAAEKSLSTQVIKLGASCMVTAVIFDLKTAASESSISKPPPPKAERARKAAVARKNSPNR